MADLLLGAGDVAEDHLLCTFEGNKCAGGNHLGPLEDGIQSQTATSQEELGTLLSGVDRLIHIGLVHETAGWRWGPALSQATAQVLDAHAHAAGHLSNDECQLLQESVELATALMNLLAALAPVSSGSWSGMPLALRGHISGNDDSDDTAHQAVEESRDFCHFLGKSRGDSRGLNEQKR